MPKDFVVFELGSYKLKFDRNIFSGLDLKQPLPNLIYVRKKMDERNTAIISIDNYDAGKVEASYVINDIHREFGEIKIDNMMHVREKLGNNLWHVFRITEGKSSHINVWIYELDVEIMIKVVAAFTDIEDPIYSQIREMIASIKIETIDPVEVIQPEST